MNQSTATRKSRSPSKSLVPAIAAILLTAGVQVAAAPVLIDFEEQPTGSRTNNFTSKGFIFSPSCSYGVLDTYNGTAGQTAAPFGNWLGFTVSGCFGGGIGANTNYLGPPGVASGGLMYVASESGQSFNLNSFVFATVANDSFGVDVYSSRGGFAAFSWSGGNFVENTFTGADWRNLDWLVFSTRIAGAPAGFDNLNLNTLPIPSTLWLLLSATLILVVRGRLRPQGSDEVGKPVA